MRNCTITHRDLHYPREKNKKKKDTKVPLLHQEFLMRKTLESAFAQTNLLQCLNTSFDHKTKQEY